MKDITLKSGVKEFGFLLQDKNVWLGTKTISDAFDKEHKHVLEKIRTILKEKDDFTETNFRLSEYKDSTGKKNKEYLLNSKSFALVVMGFTGQKALKFKKDYINAFEGMKDLIETRELAKAGYTIMTDAIQKYLDEGNTYTYSNEANMINMLVLGMTAKQFKDSHNLNKSDANRDHYALEQLDIWDKCQRLNASLITVGISFQERKEMIKKYYEDLDTNCSIKVLK